MHQSLLLNEMEIYVNLGCSEEEKNKKQTIKIDLELECGLFNNEMKDNLNETICYYELRNNIQKFCDAICYNIIEYLANQILIFLEKSYSNLKVKYLKIVKNPPMSQMKSACFIIRK